MSAANHAEPVIKARNLGKRFGSFTALRNVDLDIQPGRIVGLIGRNGAGKTTALKAILGLTPFDGSLEVLGQDPFRDRDRLMTEVSYIADIAVLPKWMKVSQVLDFADACHPNFSRSKALETLGKTDIQLNSRIKTLSKGMTTQLHLALVMAIDARLLVLDEPTIGLDVVYRKHFYSSLLSDYFDHTRTILVTTHQVEEIEDMLTDIIFIERGEILLTTDTESIGSKYTELRVSGEQLELARQLNPLDERREIGGSVLLFENIDRPELEKLGEVRTPRLAELFVAKVAGDKP